MENEHKDRITNDNYERCSMADCKNLWASQALSLKSISVMNFGAEANQRHHSRNQIVESADSRYRDPGDYARTRVSRAKDRWVRRANGRGLGVPNCPEVPGWFRRSPGSGLGDQFTRINSPGLRSPVSLALCTCRLHHTRLLPRDPYAYIGLRWNVA